MLEGELEAAICRSYPTLLPDLAADGYRLISQQAVLLGRRLDLLLRTPSGATCIIELKVGAPPMPATRDQILDYRECWTASFPDSGSPRLMVISDAIPECTSNELANFGIETRTITAAQVAAALEAEPMSEPVAKSLQLIPDDAARVRHLLSDYDAVAVRPGLVLGPAWNHEKVFLALVARGERHKDLWKKDIYVELYPQRPACAVLYEPRVQVYSPGPVHLNPRQLTSWRPNVFERMRRALAYVRTDNKGPGKERNNFDWYRVTDWDAFAEALGLLPSSPSSIKTFTTG